MAPFAYCSAVLTVLATGCLVQKSYSWWCVLSRASVWWPASDVERMDAVLERCLAGQQITEGQVKELCLKAREILIEESNVQWIDSPITVSLLALQS